MTESSLLHELPLFSAERAPERPAVRFEGSTLDYGELGSQMDRFSSGLLSLGVGRGERVAIYLEKRFEWVVAAFGAAAAGMVFVPVNPLLKPEQVGYILRDCGVCVLVTSPERHAQLATELQRCPTVRDVVLTGRAADDQTSSATLRT